MKVYYEKQRENNTRLSFSRNANHTFTAHFHSNLEVFLLARGRYEVRINDTVHELQGGEIVVFDSYDVHSYQRKDEDCESCVLIIPFSYLQRFNSVRKNQSISEKVLHNPSLCQELLSLADNYLTYEKPEPLREATIDLILMRLSYSLTFVDSERKNECLLIRSILTYVHEHFRESISRNTMAKALGYTEAHLSRTFHRYLGLSIPKYVNGLRLEYIAKQLKSGSSNSIEELIFQAGFSSTQTYYRAKKQIPHV